MLLTGNPQVSTCKNFRRLFIAAAALALAVGAFPAAAANWWTQTPTLAIGSTVLNVRNFGAMGNGVNDDTAAFQAAVNALPTSGGTIEVPDGLYMINALEGVSLPSHTRLALSTNASLEAIPNNADRYWVVKVWNVNNVEIEGGYFFGERSQHQGTTGEWGYGINIQGSSNIYVHDTMVANSWGDGILVGGTGSGNGCMVSTGVTLNRVTSTNNRRQGLTIAPATQVYVANSTFSASNGTAPQAGIDIEPQTQGLTQQVRIEDVNLLDNVGNGLEVHENVSSLTLLGITAENNQGYGIFLDGANGTNILGSNLSENYLFGLDIAGNTANVAMVDNTVEWNGDTWFYQNNQSIFSEGWVPRDITIAGTAVNVQQANNFISPMR